MATDVIAHSSDLIFLDFDNIPENEVEMFTGSWKDGRVAEEQALLVHDRPCFGGLEQVRVSRPQMGLRDEPIRDDIEDDEMKLTVRRGLDEIGRSIIEVSADATRARNSRASTTPSTPRLCGV